MNQVFEQSKDLHVRNTYVYAKNADPYVYADSATTVKIDAATLHDLFLKGVIVVDGVVEYKAVSFGIAAGVATLTYVKADAVTPATAVLTTLKSSEYVAG